MTDEAVQVATTILHDEPCQLGEGPTYDQASDTAWWSDILGKTLFEHRFATGETRRHALPFMASQLSFVDDGRQLVAADKGLFLRDVASGELTLVNPLEADNAATRSNDGRTHPSGALWIGTMGLNGERGAGAIYWFRGGEVRQLYPNANIPNAICFAPDGRTGYFTGTVSGKLMRVALDPATGLPTEQPSVIFEVPADDAEAHLDGAVVDADGLIWVARWGGARVTALAPDGTVVREVPVPARQSSCPAFVGAKLDRMLVTTAHQGLDAESRAADPEAGKIFLLDFPMRGRADPRVLL
ncbi:SMP-30/gluconolactonase/LRE family protein [Aureimonas leprariae]|uniref:SMP-30/gluconolactonase/LRE family protein n=1 Tax=Plantimonas leprariae TaxID=2615207 RepID=A0A7V7PQU5_9HYPH|nr:SMP-30/gluconolactonase/LRE family protein [Aureimonas leprariae]KAB0680737.1 SMP-30/gluconolactonase/LRE family protein [Aureimonas leprariae]